MSDKVFCSSSRIDGDGCFAAEPLAARRKIGHITGPIISWSAARRRAKQSGRVAIVERNDGTAINLTAVDHPLRFVNHSCSPNAWLRVNGRWVEFYALRAIGPGEEVTCNYGVTHHGGALRCRCGAPNCRGSL